MNERIKQLQFQAAAQIPPLLEASEWQHEFTKKFAELIVRECADFLTDDLDYPDAALKLMENFGVEE